MKGHIQNTEFKIKYLQSGVLYTEKWTFKSEKGIKNILKQELVTLATFQQTLL